MMRYSPAHYRHRVTTPKEKTRAMTVGALADAMILGGRDWAQYPGKVRSGREWELFQASHAGYVIGIASEINESNDIATAVRADETAQSLLSAPDLQRQTCHQWSAFGLECSCGVPGERGGIDAHSLEKRILVDLKVTVSAEPDKLMRHAYERMWHAQLAWYLEAMPGLSAMWTAYLLCVEATAPHCVTVLRVPESILTDGRKSLTLWAEKLRASEESGRWPGYTDSVVEMTRPAWIEELNDDDT
jgi:hypothetical protein